MFLTIALILNSIVSKETLKLITIKNLAFNSNITVAPKATQGKRLQSRKNILSVIGVASGVIKSDGFRISAKIKIEDSSEDLTQKAYKSQMISLLNDLKKLNVTTNQITFLNYKMRRECQTCFLIKLKPLNFIATADLSIEADNFYMISKLLESKSYLFDIQVFMKYDYDNLLEEIKTILANAVENGIAEAQKKLENKNNEIKRVVSTSISVNSIDTVYNYKNEEQKFQYADKFLKHQFVDFVLRINFLIGKKINTEDGNNEAIKSLEQKIVDNIAVNALNAYVDS